MKTILDSDVFGGYTARDVLILVGVTLVLLILLRILMLVFKKEESSKYFQFADCLSCGWRGRVSTLAGRCPKCNQPLGEQKARRMK
jgi:predicted Zn-ribbon and HTH transcriptional regulator